MSLPAFSFMFVLFEGAWILSTIFHTKFLAKGQINYWIESNQVVRNLAFVIPILYYGVFAIIGIGLIIFSVGSGKYTIFLISVSPILLVSLMLIWGLRKHVTYADQLSILLIFLAFSSLFVPLGMTWALK